jgi:hypothetical protein
MKKSIVLILLVGVLFSCTKEETQSLKDRLVSSETGWDLASFSHDIDSYSYDSLDHYTNVGNFVFNNDNTGVYTYEGTTANFNYYAYTTDDKLLIKFNYYEIPDFSSPFLFYAAYYKSYFDNEFGPEWEEAFEMNVDVMSDYSYRWWAYDLGIEMFILKAE